MDHCSSAKSHTGIVVTLHLKTLRQLHLWFPIDSHGADTIYAVEALKRPSKRPAQRLGVGGGIVRDCA